MKRLLLVAVVAALLIVPAQVSASADHYASCNWRTDGAWFYSPTYNETLYYAGHQIINGHYWREFRAFYPLPDHSAGQYKHDDFVYCG